MMEEKLNRPNSLFYLPSLNKFADNEWNIIHTLNRLFNTWQLDEWKRRGEDSYMTSRDGTRWFIYYLDEYDEGDILELIHWNGRHGIRMDRAAY